MSWRHKNPLKFIFLVCARQGNCLCRVMLILSYKDTHRLTETLKEEKGVCFMTFADNIIQIYEFFMNVACFSYHFYGGALLELKNRINNRER